MTTKTIAQTIVGIGSLALVKRSTKLLKKPTPKKLTKGIIDFQKNERRCIWLKNQIKQ